MADETQTQDPRRSTIRPNGYVHTPADWDEISRWCKSTRDPMSAQLSAGMAWNLAAELATGTVASVAMLDAGHDLNGNPRRALIATDPNSGRTLATVRYAYEGERAALESLDLPDGWTAGPVGLRLVDLTWRTFERLAPEAE